MITVLSSGIYSSLQDSGRFGHRNIGVPTSGVMDAHSAKLANALLNNERDCAVIEMTYQGVSLAFHRPAILALTGAVGEVFVNEKAVRYNAVVGVEAGDVWRMGTFTQGVRAYLAIAGGFDAPIVLNSRSYYAGVTSTSQLLKGDELYFDDTKQNIINRASIKANTWGIDGALIEVLMGPEFASLSKEVRSFLRNAEFSVAASSNRMAYQLINPTITSGSSIPSLGAPEIISSAVQVGTVQLTPAGQLLVLMRDCQTTGGYARVLQLTRQSIDRIAQKRPGQKLRFDISRPQHNYSDE